MVGWSDGGIKVGTLPFLLEGHLMSVSQYLHQRERKWLSFQYSHQLKEEFLNLKEQASPFPFVLWGCKSHLVSKKIGEKTGRRNLE